MWDFTSPTGFYETPHDWDANYSDKRLRPLPDPLTTTRNSKGVLFRKSKGALTRKTKGV